MPVPQQLSNLKLFFSQIYTVLQYGTRMVKVKIDEIKRELTLIQTNLYIA